MPVLKHINALSIKEEWLWGASSRIEAPSTEKITLLFNKSLYTDHPLSSPSAFDQKFPQMVSTVSQEVTRCQQNEESSRDSFKNLLTTLGLMRAEIAQDDGSDDLEDFGELRTIPSSLLLNSRYAKCGQLAYESLQNFVEQSKPFIEYFSDETIPRSFKTNPSFKDPLETSLEFRILPAYSLKTDKISEVVREAYEYSEPSNRELSFCVSLPPEELAFYTVWKGSSETRYPLSHLYLNLHQSLTQNRQFKPFNEHSIVGISHTAPENIDQALQDLEDLFVDCVCHSPTRRELDQNVSLFAYLFAHVCPYLRGSASILEAFVKGIYHSAGYQFSYGTPHIHPNGIRENPCLDLQALITTYPNFKKAYDLHTKIEPLIPSKA